MLVGTPLPVKLSVFRVLGPPLWIRRVLVRAQEAQLAGRCDNSSCLASCLFGPCKRFTSVHAAARAATGSWFDPCHRRDSPNSQTPDPDRTGCTVVARYRRMGDRA